MGADSTNGKKGGSKTTLPGESFRAVAGLGEAFVFTVWIYWSEPRERRSLVAGVGNGWAGILQKKQQINQSLTIYNQSITKLAKNRVK